MEVIKIALCKFFGAFPATGNKRFATNFSRTTYECHVQLTCNSECLIGLMCIWIKTANKMVLRDRSREQTLNLISGLEHEWQKIPWASQTGKNLAWDKRLKPGFIQLPVLLKGWNHLRFIYSLLDLPTQGFECHWNLIFRGHQKNWHKMLLDENSAGGFWLVHQASEQSDILGLRVVLFLIHIILFGAFPLLECNVRQAFKPFPLVLILQWILTQGFEELLEKWQVNEHCSLPCLSPQVSPVGLGEGEIKGKTPQNP